jgi:hypothetical protein
VTFDLGSVFLEVPWCKRVAGTRLRLEVGEGELNERLNSAGHWPASGRRAGRSGVTSESRLRKRSNELSCIRANVRYRGQSLTQEVSVSEKLDAEARGY